MSDSTERLHRALSDLHDELAETSSLDQDSRTMLDGALAEIREALDRGAGTTDSDSAGAEGEHHENLVGQLSDAARHFEESHPNLFGMVGSVIDALGRMGI